MQTSFLLVLLILLLLIFKKRQNGNMRSTAKKLIFGLVLTILTINIIMAFIM